MNHQGSSNAPAQTWIVRGWCTSLLQEIRRRAPENFANSSALTPENRPVWGTCSQQDNHRFESRDELDDAVSQWLTDPTAAEETYGDISTWDVSQITYMAELFRNGINGDTRNFNENISAWKVDQVKDMGMMFDYASSFNQPLNEWNVGQVWNMNSMFREASAFTGPCDLVSKRFGGIGLHIFH